MSNVFADIWIQMCSCVCMNANNRVQDSDLIKCRAGCSGFTQALSFSECFQSGLKELWSSWRIGDWTIVTKGEAADDHSSVYIFISHLSVKIDRSELEKRKTNEQRRLSFEDCFKFAYLNSDKQIYLHRAIFHICGCASSFDWRTEEWRCEKLVVANRG